MTWLTSQIGAREHYAIPRALYREGRLGGLYTDWWSGPLARRWGPARLRGRFHEELAGVPVTPLPCCFMDGAIRQFFSKKSSVNPYREYERYGKKFSEGVAYRLRRHHSSLAGSLFFAYDTGFLEAGRAAQALGARTVVGQMDPGRVEFSIVQEEEKQFPGWSLRPLDVPEPYNERRDREWKLADRIMVNSRWSERALEQQGVPNEKITVIPLAFDGRTSVPETAKPTSGKNLTVLFLGQVILRKGIQYLLRTAELLTGEPVNFEIVGPLGIDLKAIGKIPDTVTFHGPIPRAEVDRFYREADLFALPTLSDGFALTQLEAMAQGVPVLATPCCGEVVTDGVDGWILPACEPQAWADKIRELLDRRDILKPMSAAAIEKSKHFSLNRLAKNLLALEQELLSAGNNPS